MKHQGSKVTEVKLQVPGGADWSYEWLAVDDFEGLVVEWVARSEGEL